MRIPDFWEELVFSRINILPRQRCGRESCITCLVPYEQLSETDKESDRDVARGLPRILELAGYGLVRLEDDDAEVGPGDA